MPTTARGRVLRLGLAGAAALAMAAGCSRGADDGDVAAYTPVPDSSTAATPGESLTVERLAAGLLPRDAFAPGADVQAVDIADFAALGGSLPAGSSIEPRDCTQGLAAVLPNAGGFDLAAAQSATTTDSVIIELLGDDASIEAADGEALTDYVTRCPQLTVTDPDGAVVTVDLRPIAVPTLGERSTGVALTVSFTASDGTPVSAPQLLGSVIAGQRLVFVQQVATSAAPLDEAAFGALLQRAYETQSIII